MAGVRACAFLLALASSFVAPAALAQGKAGPSVRTDPKGVTGVSPFWEHLAKGDAAAIARDFDGALAAYREAIKQSPQNPLGHHRLGQLHALRGDLKEAEVAYTTALRYADSDPAAKTRILFCLADLREREKDTEGAIARWTEFEQHVANDPKAKVLAASGAERKKRNEDWKRISAESAEVKQRIEKSQKAAASKGK